MSLVLTVRRFETKSITGAVRLWSDWNHSSPHVKLSDLDAGNNLAIAALMCWKITEHYFKRKENQVPQDYWKSHEMVAALKAFVEIQLYCLMT